MGASLATAVGCCISDTVDIYREEGKREWQETEEREEERGNMTVGVKSSRQYNCHIAHYFSYPVK